jgi:hypothetical protein
VDKPPKRDLKTANELLMKFMTEKSLPFHLTTSKYFQAYVAFISGQRFSAPSRYHLLKALDTICEEIDGKVQRYLTTSSFFSVQLDSWSSHGRHISAVMVSSPGLSVFANAYENWAADTAVNSAAALHSCCLASLGLSPDLPPTDERIPCGKLAGITSDTTAVMPKTAQEAAKMRLAKGALWIPCFSHVMNLYFLDQVREVSVIKLLLVHAKQVVTVFRLATFRKIFVQCDFPYKRLSA